MPPLKLVLLSLVLLSSTSVLAEGGSDRLIERSEALAQQRQEQAAQLATSKAPQSADDLHGMNAAEQTPHNPT